MSKLVILSLGAGVQSTTMALMAAHGEITPMPDAAIFADTAAEPRGVYSHLARLTAILPFPVHLVSAGNLGRDILDAPPGTRRMDGRPPFYAVNDKGTEGPLVRQCTRFYKLDPIRRKIREMIGLKRGQVGPRHPVVEQWIGISSDEIVRMKRSRDRYIENRWPLVEKRLHRWDCLQWLERHGYPAPMKSACTFCPYRDNAGWRDLRDNDPASFEEAVRVDAKIRNNMPGVKNTQVFVHRSLKPLDQVDLSTAEDRGQLNLFLNECEGMCGV